MTKVHAPVSFPLNEGVKEVPFLKRRYFAAIGSSSVKSVLVMISSMPVATVSATDERLFRFVNIDDLERS